MKPLRHTSGLDTNPQSTANITPASRSFPVLLLQLVSHPLRLVRLWNWESAVLSIVLRGPIFLVAGLRNGWRSALAALLTESVFCVVSAGFYGAVVQSLKDAEPQWLTGLFLAGVIPLVFQGMEYLLHSYQGTPHLHTAAIVSLVVGAISALFNWYAMRRGTLLVGGAGRSFGGDIQRIPLLLLRFFAILPVKLASKLKGFAYKAKHGMWALLFVGK